MPMTRPITDEIRIVAVNGMLGYGYRLSSLDAGVVAEPHLFGVDSGSTDGGPYYLGSGGSLTKPRQVYRDLENAVLRARRAGVPLIVGSAGFGGGRPHTARALETVERIAAANGLTLRCAVIEAEIDRELVAAALRAGKVTPMRGVPELTEAELAETERIVGQMGTAPLIAALRAEVDIVLAGRCCDAAIFAALPLLHGFDPGLAFHMAKIMECGAQCAVPLAPGDSLLGVLRRDSFTITPLDPGRVCTPESVAAHSLYEQPDPYLIVEPEGTVDTENAVFEQVDARSVRVTGSRMIAHRPPYRIKLEGARRRGFRAITVAGIRDPWAIANLDTILRSAEATAISHLPGDVSADDYTIQFRVYGRDAVLGRREPRRDAPGHEVGLVIDVVAATQELANDVLAITRASTLHCPFEGRRTTAGNLAFPFSPSDFEGGPVYDFSVYHLMEVDDMETLFPMRIVEVGGGR